MTLSLGEFNLVLRMAPVWRWRWGYGAERGGGRVWGNRGLGVEGWGRAAYVSAMGACHAPHLYMWAVLYAA